MKFTALQFYRSSTALRIRIMPATFKDGNDYPDIGGYMFTFGKKTDDGAGFDWQNAIYFMLSGNEVGEFLTLLESSQGGSIYHDPDKGKPDEGKRAKSLSVGVQGSSKFLNISSNGVKIGVSIGVGDITQIKFLMLNTIGKTFGWS
jgi:hypothetical protein